MSTKKIILIIVIMVLVASYYFLDLSKYLNLDYIKSSQDSFRVLYVEHRLTVIAGYMILYIMVTALSLPGATIMSLAGGALFGLFTGTILVSFASAIGATMACFVSRYLLREWVMTKFGGRLSRIQEGIEKEGPFYLFTLRLVPVFPFFIINLVMGLTPMRLRTFYWVSQVGMFPATIVYVNAGKEISRINSLSGIFSPGLIGSLALLGLLPLIARKSLAWYKKRKS